MFSRFRRNEIPTSTPVSKTSFHRGRGSLSQEDSHIRGLRSRRGKERTGLSLERGRRVSFLAGLLTGKIYWRGRLLI